MACHLPFHVLRAVLELPRPGVQVRLGRVRSRMDVASASRSLHRLVFRIWDLVEGTSQGATVRGAAGQEGYECRVDSISQRCYHVIQ